MTVYLDLVFILNFCYDFLLLMTVSIALKRYAKIKKLLFGALIGSISILILFLNIPNIVLFIIKLFISVVMCLISYGFKNSKYSLINISYLYMCSVILAGFLYFLDLEFSYDHLGIVFFFNGFSVNYLILIILAPIILGAYIIQIKKLKTKQNLYYKVDVLLKNNKKLELNGYLDTANKLVDPITGKKIIIVESGAINKRFIRSPIYVPYKAINYNGLLKCFSPKLIIINDNKYNNYLLGIYEGKFNIEGINCILNYKLMEDLNV